MYTNIRICVHIYADIACMYPKGCPSHSWVMPHPYRHTSFSRERSLTHMMYDMSLNLRVVPDSCGWHTSFTCEIPCWHLSDASRIETWLSHVLEKPMRGASLICMTYRVTGCLIFIRDFRQKSPIISGSFANVLEKPVRGDSLICMTYRVAKTHRMPQNAGHFSQKSH